MLPDMVSGWVSAGMVGLPGAGLNVSAGFLAGLGVSC